MNAGSPAGESTPRFTFVIAVYNVAEYLPAFLDSLAAVEVAPADLEVIFVDDGATDASAVMIDEWLRAAPRRGQLIRKANGGPASARNAGLARARGQWISFPDPDDVLTPSYLELVAAYLEQKESGEAAMLACRPVRFVDDPARPAAPHPLDFKYTDGVRLVDLEDSPSFIHLHTITGFYRADLIRTHALRFDEAVRPVFEDATFTADYLLAARRPTVAYLGVAHYLYRKRSDGTSLTDTVWRDPTALTQLTERGYLALLLRSGNPVPRWVQHTVFYDLQWLFRADARTGLAAASLSAESLGQLRDVLGRIVQHLDETTLLEFHAVDIPVLIRLAMVARRGAGLPAQNAYVTKLDAAQQIMQISYFSERASTDEVVRVDGAPMTPLYAKTTSIRFFGEPWLYQRDVWVHALRPVAVRVGERPLPIVYGHPSAPLFQTSPVEVWNRYAGSRPPQPLTNPGPVRAGTADLTAPRRTLLQGSGGATRALRLARRLVRASQWSLRLLVDDVIPSVPTAAPSPALTSAVRRRSLSPGVRRRYRDAWILIDRDVSAQDNAEAFYRYLRRDQSHVNAWFALSRGSADWNRLERDGFRLLEFGSIDHALALRNASYLISSQADSYIVRPAQPLSGRRRWKFVFLQHGVIHNDLSRWLNAQPIRMMITTTEAEHRSIVGDRSPYTLSDKEVARTGLPRHDQLLRVALGLPAGCRRSILIAPTWRQHLLRPQGAGHQRDLAVDLEQSAYFTAWRALLASDDLRDLAERSGLEIVFLAHPHLQHHVTPEMLPAHVRLATTATGDVQRTLVEAALLITDYSSIAFDIAYLGVPVVYYQFDAAEFFSGAHTVQPGEFSYLRDGFGPVVADGSAVVRAADELLSPESPERQKYRRRADRTFTFRDGRCSERVYQAIRFREQPFTIDLSSPDREAVLSLRSSDGRERSTSEAPG